MIDISTGKEMTRRDFGKGLSAILAAGVAPSIALGALPRGLGARCGMMGGGGGGGGWVNPYVTDGLVAMWDGEWNVGKGQHDSSANYWKDLITGKSMEYRFHSTGSFGDKGLTLSANDGLSADMGMDWLPDVNTTGSTTFMLYGSWGVTSSESNFCSFLRNYVTGDYYWADIGLRYAASQIHISPGRNQIGTGKLIQPDIPYSIVLVLKYPVTIEVYINGDRSVYSASRGGLSNFRYFLINKTGSQYWFGCPCTYNAIRVYNRALTQAEITASYQTDVSRFGQ